MWESAGAGSHAGPSVRERPSDAWHYFQDMQDWKAQELRFKVFGPKHLREWNWSLIYMDLSIWSAVSDKFLNISSILRIFGVELEFDVYMPNLFISMS